MVDAFAVLLRRHRLHRRLTQETLAELAGVSSRSIGELERGRGRGPRPGTVERLAAALRLVDADRQEFIESGRGVFWGSRIGRPVMPPDHGSLVPAQLPPGTSTFVGRHAELVALDGLVARSGTDRTAPVISVVTGAAGVGKTALAVHWAQLRRSLFPEGQLYVDLRGYGPSRERSQRQFWAVSGPGRDDAQRQ